MRARLCVVVPLELISKFRGKGLPTSWVLAFSEPDWTRFGGSDAFVLASETAITHSERKQLLTSHQLGSSLNMRATSILLQQCTRLTFFTRANCSLCTDAKGVLSKVWDRRPFEYDEIDVMAPQKEHWKNLYEFDTPVVRFARPNPFRLISGLMVGQVHFDATEEHNPKFETTAAARKLMHRFSESEVEMAMDEVSETKK